MTHEQIKHAILLGMRGGWDGRLFKEINGLEELASTTRGWQMVSDAWDEISDDNVFYDEHKGLWFPREEDPE